MKKMKTNKFAAVLVLVGAISLAPALASADVGLELSPVPGILLLLSAGIGAAFADDTAVGARLALSIGFAP